MIEAVKENLCINRVVGNKTFQIIIEGDSIIPDTKPDILKDIAGKGNVCIYKKEILDGKIRLDGNVNIYLMYLADSDEQSTRAFNSNIDETVQIKNIETNVINGRKVGFRVTLAVDAKVFLNEDEEVIKEIRGIDDIQMQMNSIQMNSLVRTKYHKSYSKRNYCNK